MDTINFYFHDKALRDNPPLPEAARNASIAPMVNPYNHQDHLYSKSQPENIAFLERFRALTDHYDGRACLGEVGDAQRGLELMAAYTEGDKRMHMCYAFEFLGERLATAQFVKEVFDRLEREAEDAWPCWAFSNHDVMRHVTRWNLGPEAMRLYPVMMMCLRGTVCLYQGEELGLAEADVAFDDLQDPYGIEFWPEFKGRDGCRTPMVWMTQSENAGFGDGKTWLPVDKTQAERAVDRQDADPNSILQHYRKLIAFRHRHPELMTGAMHDRKVDGEVLSFLRSSEEQTLFCAFNLGEQPADVWLPEGDWQAIASELRAVSPIGGAVALPGWSFSIVVRRRG